MMREHGMFGMFGMGGGGGLLFMVVIAALVIIPFWKLLPQYGMPNWLAVAAIIPFGAIVLLWVMAFRDKLGGRS